MDYRSNKNTHRKYLCMRMRVREVCVLDVTTHNFFLYFLLQMVTLILVTLLISCFYAHALPSPPLTWNTIFLDERLEGEIFEDIDAFNDLSNDDIQKYRLPTTTRPVSYTVLWVVDTNSQTFSGNVAINLVATQANVSDIVIHAHDMTIESVVLQRGDVAIPQNYTLESDLHFLRTKLASGFLQFDGTNPILYTLKIAFNGNLRDDMSGMYKTWFRNNPSDETIR